jgi:hypothetical protein
VKSAVIFEIENAAMKPEDGNAPRQQYTSILRQLCLLPSSLSYPYNIRILYYKTYKVVRMQGRRVVYRHYFCCVFKSMPVDNGMFRKKRQHECHHGNKFQKQFCYDFSRFILMILMCNFSSQQPKLVARTVTKIVLHGDNFIPSIITF